MNDIHMKRLEEYPDYWITAEGRVYSELRGGHWMRQSLNTQGYPKVNICQGGRVTTKRVHRLVANTFIPNPEGKPEVNHRNGNKTDNRVENLEWVTPSENQRHAYDTGLRVGPTGEANGSSKLTWEQVREVRERYAAGGVLQRELGAEYGVSRWQVGKIVNGNKWRAYQTRMEDLI